MKQPENLEDEHRPEAIRQRLLKPHSFNYLGDAVLGAIDGCVTTFAVVAATIGGGFSGTVAIVLGFANLLADAFSMSVSNYQGTKSRIDMVEKARLIEGRHIERIPEGEREEIRQIFSGKGFHGEILEKIVEVISSDKKLWVDTMLTEEWRLPIDGPRPLLAAVTTFSAFSLVGVIPLVPFVVTGLNPTQTFRFSAVLTASAFFVVGAVKGRLSHRSIIRCGIETLIAGGGAAVIAYLVGTYLKRFVTSFY